MIRTWVCTAVALTMLVGHARPAKADELGKELAPVAEKASRILTDLGVKEVALGEFSPRGGTRSNYGPEIRRVLAVELNKRGIRVAKKAAHELTGNYGPAKDGNEAETFLRINLQLLDAKSGLTGSPKVPA